MKICLFSAKARLLTVRDWALAVGLSALPLFFIALVSIESHAFLLAAVLHFLILGGAAIRSLADFAASLSESRASAWHKSVLFLALLAWVGAEVFRAYLPVTEGDALIHHLAVPKWWLAADRMVEIAWHEWSYYPMLTQLTFLPGLMLGIPELCAFSQILHGTLLAGVAAELAVRCSANRTIGAAAFLATLFVPIVLHLASVPLVDLPLAVYCTLACSYFIEWQSNPSAYGSAAKMGAALGLALSTKFNALLFAAVIFAGSLFTIGRASVPLRRALIAALMCGAFAALLYSPWMTRSYMLTGNPFFPLLRSWFTDPQATPAAAGPGGLNPIEHRLLVYGETWWEVALLPLRIFFEGQDDSPRLFDGRLSPLLLLFLFSFSFRPSRASGKFLVLVNITYLMAALLLSGARVRYLAPIFGSLVAGSCLGCAALLERMRYSYRGTAAATILWGHIALGSIYGFNLVANRAALDYVRGTRTKEQYLSARIPDYSLIAHINASVPAQAKIYLVLTGNRFFYFERDAVSAGHHSARELIGWIAASSNSDELRSEFTSRHITHLMVHVRRLKDLLGPTLSDQQKRVWSDFYRDHLAPAYEANGFALFELR